MSRSWILDDSDTVADGKCKVWTRPEQLYNSHRQIRATWRDETVLRRPIGRCEFGVEEQPQKSDVERADIKLSSETRGLRLGDDLHRSADLWYRATERCANAVRFFELPVQRGPSGFWAATQRRWNRRTAHELSLISHGPERQKNACSGHHRQSFVILPRWLSVDMKRLFCTWIEVNFVNARKPKATDFTWSATWKTAAVRQSFWAQCYLSRQTKVRNYDTIRYDTIRDAILTCARKPTRVSLIYRTEPTTKKWKTEKVKTDMLRRSKVNNILGNPCDSPEKGRKATLGRICRKVRF